MTRRAKGPGTDLQLFQTIALSLATEELQQGLDVILTLALQQGTENGEPEWDLLRTMGYNDYDILCVKAAHAWIKRVTGINYNVSGVTRFDKQKPKPPRETTNLTIDEIEEA